MIIAPILIDLKRQNQEQINIFSGIDFTVEPEKVLYHFSKTFLYLLEHGSRGVGRDVLLRNMESGAFRNGKRIFACATSVQRSKHKNN
ncbi:hypothetical protein AFK68_08465 [Hydrocoleum sp. CS-953]|nr:hypothetical protein AFK68_08465 [Hydrocoleum sp. CS-953]